MKIKTICLLFTLLSISDVFAAQWATVTAERAVIYADKEMSSSIGFIKKGKKLRVGEKTRRGGRLLPLIVRKKIVYIKVDDISTSSKETELELASQRMKDVQTKSDEKRVSLFYSGYAALMSIDAGDTFENQSYDGVLFYYNGFGVRGYISSAGSKKTWRVSLETSSTTSELNTFTFVTLTPELSYDLIKYDNYVFRGYAGVPLIPFAQNSYNSLFTVNGFGAGISVGAEMEFKLRKSIGLHVDAGYKFKKLFFNVPESPTTEAKSFNPVFNGAAFSLALSYAY